jgi:hypothetical protein
VKIRNITLGANIPQRLVQRVGAESMRIYFTAQDPFMYTNTTAIDPEGRTSAGTPSYRTLLLGGSFGF